LEIQYEVRKVCEGTCRKKDKLVTSAYITEVRLL
jgi:hypothetical protein